ncbi:hypothetical protein VT84_09815 [Gemmata sp. SH-PL17]|uniref:hypothetical protein n=1 Tax=Gemmata sp. SH-PL17 TaxID=1630693 RepID=UPI0004B6E2B9|nr:hypothetical protein [Gemmata sp. SH-PL17]AMV24680.1 hypothetical protein VT84_09815 [Gemmata sp. SH-PL17]
MEASEALRQALGGYRAPTLADVNELARYHCDFHVQSFDGLRLVVVGSFDLCYYHGLELHFVEVARIDCPVRFHNPTFADEGPVSAHDGSAAGPRRYAIRSDEGAHTILAGSVEIVFGTVYYYDRGAALKSGERIAPWVKRAKTEPAPAT